jgi:hypothetical protein
MTNAKEAPKYLYKFRSFDKDGYYKTFLESKLYFPSPKNFNDPFDTKIPVHYDLGTNDEIIRFLKTVYDRTGSISGEEALKKAKNIFSKNGRGFFADRTNVKNNLWDFIDNEFGICSLLIPI